MFVGKIFMLKIFRRVDIPRKYFNMKILQHRSREECTERVTAMEKFFKRNCIRGDGWRDVDVRKRAQKLFRSIRCGCEKQRNYHRTFTLKAVTGVFTVFATGIWQANCFKIHWLYLIRMFDKPFDTFNKSFDMFDKLLDAFDKPFDIR